MDNTIPPETHAPIHPLSDAPELCQLNARQLNAAYLSGELSPVEVALATMERASAINPLYNAFTSIDDDGALQAARASEKRWLSGKPLSASDGIPTTLKDIVWVDQWQVRYGSTTTTTKPFTQDAPAVSLLRSAGAVFIGQTTTPEFGWKAVTDSKLAGVTRNPWDRHRTPGGSSGGAAVAAITGAGVFHLGTDGGGSVRIPASFTGIAGLKPSFGRVPAYPPSPFGTVAHLGPMVRCAKDLPVMLNAMAGRAPSDWHQCPADLPALSTADAVLQGARIGYWSTPPFGEVDPEVAQAISNTLPLLQSCGASIEPVELPGDDLLDLFHKHWFAGAAARISQLSESDKALVDPGLLDAAATGGAYGVAACYLAQTRRAEFGRQMDKLLDTFDFIISPATAIPAFGAGLEVPADSGLERWTQWAGFSYPINLSQQPASAIPCGMTQGSQPLPIGLQIIGARGADAQVLSAAIELESKLGDLLNTPGN